MLLLVLLTLVVLGAVSMLVSTISGGGLNVVMIPILVLAYGLSPGQAIGTMFLALTVGTFVAAVKFTKEGHVDLRNGIVLGVTTVPGVVAGSYLSYLAEGPAFGVLLGAVIVALAVLMAVRPPASSLAAGREERGAKYSVNMRAGVPLMVSIGFFIGFFGQGGGLLLVPALQFIGLPVVATLGTVRVIAFLTGGTGFLARLAVFQVNVVYGAALAVGTSLGGFLGAKVSVTVRVQVLRVTVAVVIAFLGVLLILSQLL